MLLAAGRRVAGRRARRRRHEGPREHAAEQQDRHRQRQRHAFAHAEVLLAEVVALAGAARPRFNIETKISPLAPDDTRAAPDFARAVIAEIRRLGIADRTTLQSFDWRTLAVAAREAPEMDRAYLTTERGAGETVYRGRGVSPWTGLDIAAHGDSTPRLVAAAGGRIWSPFFRDLDTRILAEAKALGLSVIPWTVNESADMERLLGWGIDGLITDYPDRAKALLDRRGIAVRAPR